MEYVKYYLIDLLGIGIVSTKAFRAVGELYSLTVACRSNQNIML